MIDLIRQANSLLESLDNQAEKELNICFNSGIILEQLSQDMRKLVSELREVYYYKGVEDELL